MEPYPEPDPVLAILQKDYQSIKACLEDKHCKHSPQQIIELIYRSLMLIEDELLKKLTSTLLKMRELFTQALQKFHKKWMKNIKAGLSLNKGGINNLKSRRTPLKRKVQKNRKFGYIPSPEKLILLYNFILQLGRMHIEYGTFELMFFGNKKLTEMVIYDGPGKELVRIFYLLKWYEVIVENEYIQVICSNFKTKKGEYFNSDSLNASTREELPNGLEEKLMKIIRLMKGE